MGDERDIVLSVKDIKKTIKGKEIIKGISFDVYGGEIFGFLGPNGSGKTTTIRMLVGLIAPTAGSITICGCDVHKQHNEALQHIGCIVENPELYSYLSGWENLEHFARMLPAVTDQRIQEVVDIVGMDARIHDKVKTYSLGMRQRLGIAQALLNNPKLLILDEPTNGLDPQGIKEMREFILQLAKTGLSLFVSSHLLSEIQQMCDRVAIISHGEVITVGEVDALIDESASRVVWRVAPLQQALSMLNEEPDVQVLYAEEGTAEHHTAAHVVTQLSPEAVPDVTRRLVESGIHIFGVETKNPTLEDLFLSLTEGKRIG
ncbi:ABC transporter ATP-binding protein [Paenibacillus xerothermodurans]|uniref:ABC transporter ATP-binding protein n=1 Tax=Paenibacillus xerothermodurans TaxID=1977292 RepID=A0A2W1ND67_PAEXE|nr:ABC transporter ATP-binding protein [Paenibacillus xerothermodurans]PZE21894.1 ABC transporter ATP-binding protein [Paenibacillus xerothermodurans]